MAHYFRNVIHLFATLAPEVFYFPFLKKNKSKPLEPSYFIVFYPDLIRYFTSLVHSAVDRTQLTSYLLLGVVQIFLI